MFFSFALISTICYQNNCQSKCWDINLYIFRDCHSFVDSSNFTNKANSYTPKVKIHTRPNLCHIGRYVAKTKQFLSKKYRPGYRAGAFIWKDLHLFYRDLRRKNSDLGYWTSPAFHVNTSKFLQLKKKYRGEISEPDSARLTRLL